MNDFDKRLAHEAAQYLAAVRANIKRCSQEMTERTVMANWRAAKYGLTDPRTLAKQTEVIEWRAARRFWLDARPDAIKKDRYWKEYKKKFPDNPGGGNLPQ